MTMIAYLFLFLLRYLLRCVAFTLGPSINILPNSSNLTMATNPNINRILSVWFDPRYPYTRWFIPSDELDAEITSNFESLVIIARTTTNLDNWTQSPGGTLALMLLLEQLPRNIYRESAEAFSSDQKALNIAKKAISQGFDRTVTLVPSAFFYLPFEHDENLDSQNECVALFEALAARSKPDSQEREFADKCVGYAVRHRDVIAASGRFPLRNSVLGRQLTEEELEFLKTHPQGF